MDDKKYWEKYYQSNSNPGAQSSFAEFILDYLDEDKLLVELGCGNGRDSIYFSKKLNVIGIDQVQCEVNHLNAKYSNDNIEFVCDDFTNLGKVDDDISYVYSRFTFHSINEKKEDRTLDWIQKNLNKDGLFLLEARSLKDPMFKKGRALSDSENFTNHYRRYMDLDKILAKIESRGFEIIYNIEDKDLAVYKDDNPYVIRIIAKKI